ncbi:DUF1868 domain-containing protein [Phyllobacterium endophyticum]|uniref:DUF1868 domain-containing protein n=1 Tax=Phyllobacterium endophyticum TaxID=1149773 RepID=UPI00147589B9|nr:DUF1868 domain-containing protein [Phyllobacterium endophyticum]MBB3238036.1 hypothetical protein [Phyllobacterium endophyticum]
MPINTEKILSNRTESSIAPSGVGTKFNPDGSVRPFPGNTIICHLPADSALRVPLEALYDALAQSEFAAFLALLPPASWHMTIFEGVCDQVRQPGLWPYDLPLDATLAECNDLFDRKLVHFDLGCELPLQMQLSGIRPLLNGITLRLVPARAPIEAEMRELRDRLSRLLNIRHPRHETYEFHLSIAYAIRFLSETQQEELMRLIENVLPSASAEIVLGAPEFCIFNDMFAFHRRFYLRKAKGHNHHVCISG